jgi:hypothetical protein
MTDMDLLDFMVRQYKTQARLAESLKLGDSAVSNWRTEKKIPKSWKMYFMAQFNKVDANREEEQARIAKYAREMQNANNQAGAAAAGLSFIYLIGSGQANCFPSDYQKAQFNNF